MATFAFIVHPIDPKQDVARKFPWLARLLPVRLIHFFSTYFPPVVLSRVRGVVSEATGQEVTGWLLACPLTAHQFRHLPLKRVYAKIIQTGRLAERLGADILGLGAFTSAVGDAGVTVAQALNIPVTTGDSCTVAATVALVEDVARRFERPLHRLTVAVVGATGAIGRAVARMLAPRAARLLLLSRHRRSLAQVQQQIEKETPQATVEATVEKTRLRQAHIVVGVTSAVYAVLKPYHLHPGTVVIDTAIPRDASAGLARRPEFLVLDGGLMTVPGPVDFGFNFGLPRKMAYACMVETMILALENRLECYTLGKDIPPQKAAQMWQWAEKHGFRLAPWRSFGRPVRQAQLEQFRPYLEAHWPGPEP